MDPLFRGISSQKIRQTTPKYRRGGHENLENESSKFVKRRQDIANLSLRGNVPGYVELQANLFSF